MCIRDSSKDLLCADSVVYADVDNEAYYDAQLYGFAIGNETKNEYISLKDALQDEAFLQYIKEDNQMAVYDAKNFYHTCHKHHIPCGNIAFDIMIAAFLVDGTISDYDKLQEKYNFDRSIRKDDVYLSLIHICMLEEATGQPVEQHVFKAVIMSHTGPGTIGFGRIKKLKY